MHADQLFGVILATGPPWIAARSTIVVPRASIVLSSKLHSGRAERPITVITCQALGVS
jgi:hypothetical protein